MINFQTISAKQLAELGFGNVIILDVRTEMEHGEKHLKLSHTHIPLDKFDPNDFVTKYALDKKDNIYILCRSGKRACQAALSFDFDDCPNIYVIEGGILACEDVGYAIEGYTCGANANLKRPISLERQVRIGAGILVATGAILGISVHSLFTVIPLFVGCGLIFAGITDLCGMALILTKAPWNKIKNK